MTRARSHSLLVSFVALLLALPAAGSPEASAPGTAASPLRLGSDVWPPFTDFPGRKRVAIDLVETALARAGVAAKNSIGDDFELLIENLRRGELDGSVALWRDSEREKFLVFSRPYLENRLVLLTRKGSDASATSLKQLAGKRVALVQGYSYGQEIAASEDPVIVWGRSDQENLERLLRGEVDYLLADEVLIHNLFERYGTRAQVLLEVGSVPIVERSLHFAVRRDLPGAASIVSRFDEAIGTMIADGSYNRALGMTWIRADVDGDGKSELILGGEQAGESAPTGGYDVFALGGAGEAATQSKSQDKSPNQESGGYVVDGKIYHRWSDIPPRYRVPEDRQIDRKGDSPEPGISIFQF